MLRTVLLAGIITVTGCTSVSQSQQGLDLLNEGNKQAAFDTFTQCARQGDSACINNIGFMYEKGHMDTGPDTDRAIQYYTLAARYGQPTAQQNLLLLGAPVPAVDLQVQPTAQGTSDTATNLLLMLNAAAVGYNAGQVETNRQPVVTESKAVRCQSVANGDYVNTTCR